MQLYLEADKHLKSKSQQKFVVNLWQWVSFEVFVRVEYWTEQSVKTTIDWGVFPLTSDS
jgi:hypothetical protein